ncbi:MAG: hypothetical protein ACI841_001703 [Planctomycetota bacterium]|jgi:uncharacterized protein (DUF952 family)
MTEAKDIYHAVSCTTWAQHLASGGGGWDAGTLASEGFVHLSSREQLAESLRRHTDPSDELWVFQLDAQSAGAALRWDESRDGALFPHLYRAIEAGDVLCSWKVAATEAADGARTLPDFELQQAPITGMPADNDEQG